jgi:hypothetical protein
LLVGICLDQARVDYKALAANQTGRNARLDNPLEHTALAEALVAGTRKRRMIRDSIFDAKPRTSDRKGSPVCSSRQINRSERIAKTYPTTSIRIISSGSIEGRPIDE